MPLSNQTANVCVGEAVRYVCPSIAHCAMRFHPGCSDFKLHKQYRGRTFIACFTLEHWTHVCDVKNTMTFLSLQLLPSP
eukprot:c44905_g1_i1 orf=145-381(-)